MKTGSKAIGALNKIIKSKIIFRKMKEKLYYNPAFSTQIAQVYTVYRCRISTKVLIMSWGYLKKTKSSICYPDET